MKTKTTYQQPLLEILEVKAEQGFAVTGGDPDVSNDLPGWDNETDIES